MSNIQRSPDASNIPPDVLFKGSREVDRGVDPEVAMEIGEFVAGHSELRPEDQARAMVENPISPPSPVKKEPTSREKNEAYERFHAAHNRRKMGIYDDEK